MTGGDIDGEPYDTRVDLDGTVTTFSLFATDTLPIGERVHLTVSGRYNRTTIDNRDQLQPGGGPGSLDGDHTYSRFNPAAGVTVDALARVDALCGLQRRQPRRRRRSSWDAPIPRSRASCRTRWPAIRRSNRS